MVFCVALSNALYFRGKGIFVGIAFVVIGSYMIFSVGWEWLTGMQSRSWEPVEAVVITSGTRESTSHDGAGNAYVMNELDFRYRYQVDGREHESDQLSFKKKDQVDARDIPGFIRQHPEGSALTVYYNPKHPEQAIMEPGVPTAGILFVLMPGVFVVLGPFIVWGSVNGAIVRFCEARGLRYR